MDITTDPLYQLFLQSRNLKGSSIVRYQRYLTLYSNFINLSPNDFITEAEQDEESGKRMRNRKIQTYLLNFKSHLIQEGYSPRTITGTITIVRSFYSQFDVQLPRMKIRSEYRKETIDDIPTKKDIEIALKNSNIKYQAIITLMSSSGMRSSDIRALSYGDLLNSLTDYTKHPKDAYLHIGELTDIVGKMESILVPTWQIITYKNNMPLTTFSTPESLEYLLEYLEKKPPTGLDTPIFRSNKRPNKSISRSGFFKYFNELNKRCNFGKIDKMIKFRSHALRKYFTTTLYHANINKLTIDWLLSHSVDSVTESYFKSDILSLKEQYINCIPSLSIADVSVQVLQSEDKKKLDLMEKEMKEMQEALEILQVQKGLDKPD